MKQNNLTKSRLRAWLHRLMGLRFGPIERKQKSHLAAREARAIALTPRGRTRGWTTYGFPPSCESPRFPLLLSPAQIGQRVTASK